MSKTTHVLALTLMLGALVSGTFNMSAQARDDDDDYGNFCSKFSRKIEKKVRQGKSYDIDSRKLSEYRSSCLGRRGGFSSDPGYSANSGNDYTYTRGGSTSSNNGTGYSRSSQSTYSSNTTNGGYGGGYTQQRSQTNSSYDPYDDYGYNDRPSVNVATPSSQVRVQNGGVTIRTRGAGGTGINLDF
jgi:hypothetical protein